MTDQTTYISPDLQLAEDEDGNLDIIHGDTEVYIPGPGLHPVSGVKETFRILMALTYSRRVYSDGSVSYWAFFRDGAVFWTYGDSLTEVVESAAERIGMYLAGRDGYLLFDGILDLDEVK